MAEHKNNEQVTTETFSERAPLNDAMTSAGVSAGAGLLISAVQNSLQSHNKGALGLFTRTGTTIATFTAMGGIFSYADATATNIRGKVDSVNGAIGGCAAGLVLGAVSRSVPVMAGSCAGLAALIATFDAAGHSLKGKVTVPSPSAAFDTHNDKSWREQRDERRKAFFKQKKEDVESEE